MLLLTFALPVAVVAARISGESLTAGDFAREKSADDDVVDKDWVQHGEVKRRGDCPVPCGWKNWLCCASNEICYTASNLEAECSPTALPSDSTETVTIPVIVLTSLVRSTKVVTKTLRLSKPGRQTHGTSLVTLTSVETSTVLYSSPRSKATTTAAHDGNSTMTPLMKEHHGMTTTEQAAIGGSVSDAAVLVAGAAFLCWRRRKRNQPPEEPQDGEGPDAFSPRNFAHIQDKNLNQSSRFENVVPFLQPRQSNIFSGPGNPYEDDPDGVVPPYPGSPPPAHGQGRDGGYMDVGGPLRQPRPIPGQHNALAPQYPSVRPKRAVPTRRPVGGAQPTVEDYRDV